MEFHSIWITKSRDQVNKEIKPYYKITKSESDVFRAAHKSQLPLLLKGPTGCGKTRFVEYMASEYERKLITVACNEDTSAADLIGRFLIKNGDTVWQDGPVTRAVKLGYFLYLDEIAEAREDVVVVLHSLCDHRREIHIDRLNESVMAAPGFQLVVSFNPGYQGGLKELKPSTRQRFISIDFNYPDLKTESEIILKESGCDQGFADQLSALAVQIRSLDELTLRETVSTRLLVHAARLNCAGLSQRASCENGIIHALTDDEETIRALKDLCNLRF